MSEAKREWLEALAIAEIVAKCLVATVPSDVPTDRLTALIATLNQILETTQTAN